MANVVVPQPPIIHQVVTHQQPHVDAEHVTRSTYNDGRHIHNRTVHHLDIHQPPPVVTTEAEEQPPMIVRVPVTEHVKVKVPRTIFREEVHQEERIEMVKSQREVPSTKLVPHEREEEYVEYEEQEQEREVTSIVKVKVKVPVKKQRTVVEQVEVATTKIIEEDVPVRHIDTIRTPVEDIVYDDKILEITTH